MEDQSTSVPRGWQELGLVRQHMPPARALHVTAWPWRPLSGVPTIHLSLLSFKRHLSTRCYQAGQIALSRLR